jgi:hypothetical protein
MTLVRTERPAPGIARIVLDDPAKRNALSAALRAELTAAFDAAHGDATVRAIVLTGARGAFCAGGDLSSMGTMPADAGRARMKASHRMIRSIAAAEKPVVSAIEGPAMGGGAGLALLADAVVAGEGRSSASISSRPGAGLRPVPHIATPGRRRACAAPVQHRRHREVGRSTGHRAGDRVVPDAEVRMPPWPRRAAGRTAGRRLRHDQAAAGPDADVAGGGAGDGGAGPTAFGGTEHAEGRAASSRRSPCSAATTGPSDECRGRNRRDPMADDVGVARRCSRRRSPGCSASDTRCCAAG